MELIKRRKRFVFLAVVVFIVAVLIAGSAILKSIYVVPVLMYHSIGFTDDRSNKLVVSPRSFTRQMEFLHVNRYNVVSAEELVPIIGGKKRFPARTVAITFDDGLADNYEFAFPVLKRLGMPATIFIITDKVGEEGYLSWEQIREMADSGVITIGAHTKSHAWLPGLSKGKLREELAGSKTILEEKVGRKVKFISYPLGGYNDSVKRAVKKIGYAAAFATNPGKKARADDIYAIKRVRISNSSDSLFVFWIESSGYYTWVKEHRDED